MNSVLDAGLEKYSKRMSRHEKIEELGSDSTYICIFKEEQDAGAFAEIVEPHVEYLIHRGKFVRVTFDLLRHDTRRAFAKYLHKAEYSMWNKTREIQFVNDVHKYFMLGYYAKYAWFKARPTARAEHSFVGDYFSMKSDSPEDKPGYGVDICPNTWALAMHIRFPLETAPSHICYPRDAKLIKKKNHTLIYHTDWCWRLLDMGFDLGNHHNIEEIIAHVPDQHRSAFVSGNMI